MSLPVCKFYSSKSCKYGKNCRYLHQPSQRPPPTKHPENQDEYEATVDTQTLSSPPTFKYEQQSSNQNEESVVKETSKKLEFANLHIDQQRISLPQEEDRGQQVVDTSLEKKHFSSTSKASTSSSTKKLCLHFARGGRCFYGKRCRFSHASHKEPTKKCDEQGHQSVQKKQGGASSGSIQNVPPRLQRVDLKRNDLSKEHDHLNSFNVESEKQSNDGINHEQSNLESSKGNYSLKSQSPKPNQRRICQFFKSKRCTRGERCRFWHPPDILNDVDKDSLQQITEDRDVKGNTERGSYRSGKASSFSKSRSSNANFSVRERAVQPGLKQVLTLEEVNQIGITKLREGEISVIQRRFPKDKLSTVIHDHQNFTARIKFVPTDPDWPFDVQIFEMLVSVPGDYPKEMLEVRLPKDQDLPETVRRYIEITIGEWLGEKKKQLENISKVELVFRTFLKWLDRNIEEITTEALKQFKRQLVAKAAGMEFFSPQQLQEKLRTNSESTDGSDNNSDGTSDNESTSCTEEENESNDTDDDLEETGYNHSLNLDPQKKGTEIELRHLQLKENASACLFDKLKVILQCGRCKDQADLVVHQGKVMSTTCAKCSQNQFVHFRPALVHQFSSTVGYLDVDGCHVFDLILQDCSVHVTCLSCSKETKIEGLVSGQMIDGWCRACNAKFKLATESVKFTQLVPSGVDTSVSKVVEVAPAKARKPPKDPAIREGYPLPEFGTCKHYKHSYRWLRFPCCGKAYPCDICHDKKEDHEMTFANRMICGHCCKEQNFSGSRPCNSCSQHMTKVRSAHWEGGSGCRDKIAMSKTDQQKYRSMNKTISNHKKKVKSGSSKKNTKLRHT